MKKMTAEQINKKYAEVYVELGKEYDYKNQCWVYEVHKTSKKIRENMTLGKDVGTQNEYRR